MGKKPRSKSGQGAPQDGILSPDAAGHGVIVVAQNGDVIRYDPSGVVLRLSDRVIADIALRLPQGQSAAPRDGTRAQTRLDPADHLEGVDAWDLRQEGDWLFFNAHLAGRQGLRAFRRPVTGGAIMADAAGPIYAILGIGGPRAALALARGPHFPHHIMAPADDIGAVGMAGIEAASAQTALAALREMTHEALVAETLLDWQMEKFEALRLFMVRAETDTSATARALTQGAALGNLMIAAENLRLVAQAMGKSAKILAICLDYALEQVGGEAHEYRDGMIALMDAIQAGLAKRGFDRPLFLARFDCGSAALVDHPAIAGQWELGWNHGEHRLIQTAPSYMFALDDHDRPTDAARIEMAEMTAAALAMAQDWACPRLYLAEQSRKSPTRIRVTLQAKTPLYLDLEDPFDAGPQAGFRLIGAKNGAKITKVEIDPKDDRAVIVTCDKAPSGADLRLAYAVGAAPRAGAYAANCGALADEWGLTSATGRRLRRYALPACLPVTQGGQDD